VGEDESGLRVVLERSLEMLCRLVVQFSVDHERHPVFGCHFKDRAEGRVVGVPLDLSGDLADMRLAERLVGASREEGVEPLRLSRVQRIRDRGSLQNLIRVLPGRGLDPLEVLLLDSSNAEQEHALDVVAGHGLDIGIQDLEVWQVGMSIYERPLVLGAGRPSPEDEKSERGETGGEQSRERLGSFLRRGR
jgi:hypothetical protein